MGYMKTAMDEIVPPDFCDLCGAYVPDEGKDLHTDYHEKEAKNVEAVKSDIAGVHTHLTSTLNNLKRYNQDERTVIN
jgi:hypothetical protein